MRFVVIIPAYNEEEFIASCLDSITNQTLLPNQLIVVNDNSTDQTLSIIKQYKEQYDFIEIVSTNAKAVHIPGSKVIQTFYKGYEAISIDYDVIFKLDADLVFPVNYFEDIIKVFKNDSAVGMAGGVATILKNGAWEIENLTNFDHIRGALKSYSKNCFEHIGGLKKDLGWDTVDEHLSRYFNFKIVVDPNLKVQHLRPTGESYSKNVAFKQGSAFYKMGYGLLLSFLASLKMALKKRSLTMFIGYLKGYLTAIKNNDPKFVNKEQSKFIQKYRWKKILNRYFYSRVTALI